LPPLVFTDTHGMASMMRESVPFCTGRTSCTIGPTSPRRGDLSKARSRPSLILVTHPTVGASGFPPCACRGIAGGRMDARGPARIFLSVLQPTESAELRPFGNAPFPRLKLTIPTSVALCEALRALVHSSAPRARHTLALSTFDKCIHVVAPHHQRVAHLARIAAAIIDSGGARLVPGVMAKHGLDHVRHHAEIGHASRDGSAQIMQAPFPNGFAEALVEIGLGATPAESTLAAIVSEHVLAPFESRLLGEDRPCQVAQRYDVRLAGLGPLRREPKHPVLGIDLRLFQAADLLSSAAGQDQQLDDPAKEGRRCVPDGDQLGVRQNPFARL